MLVCALGLASFAQIPIPNAQPAPPGEIANSGQGQSIKVDVNLVVLHTTVLDDRGRFAEGLKQDNFRVLEDKVEQKLAVFKREDVPVSMGLVIDNSGSMRDKRPRVNQAALTLVQTSNPQDEAFVVNFNDDFYLDLDKDFTNSVPELKEALERIDSRGSTALYDAVIGSLDHLKKASKDKRVLLIVTDGEDGGVVMEAEIDQHIERPQRGARHREARRPVTLHRLPDDVFETPLGPRGLVAKLLRRLPIDQLVREAVTGDLVTGFRDASHQPGGTLGHPPEHEERAPYAVLSEQHEQPLGVGLDPGLVLIPALPWNRRRQRGDVVVVLDVDRKGVDPPLGGRGGIRAVPISTLIHRSLRCREATYCS